MEYRYILLSAYNAGITDNKPDNSIIICQGKAGRKNARKSARKSKRKRPGIFCQA